MSSLEDKILGEKKEYYCSSSSEDENDFEYGLANNQSNDPGPPPVRSSDGEGSVNTGPKGVIKDWQMFKQIESKERSEKDRERLALLQKLSLTCRNDLPDQKEEDLELDDEFLDPFLKEYSIRRMSEMIKKLSEMPKFGEVFTLSTGQNFLDAIDNENKDVKVIIHIYDEKVKNCNNMNICLNELCKQYPEVKFCKLSASTAGVSKHFKVSGLPALLVYKNGNLIGNFVKISEELDDEFTANDVENFLIENGMLTDKSCFPKIIQSSENKDSEVD